MIIYLHAVIAYIRCSEILRKSGKVNVGKIAVISSSLNIALDSLKDLSARFSYSQSDFSNCTFYHSLFTVPQYLQTLPNKVHFEVKSVALASGPGPKCYPYVPNSVLLFQATPQGIWTTGNNLEILTMCSFFFWGLHIILPPSLPKSPYFLHLHSHLLFWHKNFTAFSMGRSRSLELIQGIRRGYQN